MGSIDCQHVRGFYDLRKKAPVVDKTRVQAFVRAVGESGAERTSIQPRPVDSWAAVDSSRSIKTPRRRFGVYACQRANEKGEEGGAGESQSSPNARLVCKWVLIDAFSPFVCLMEKHFSLNCHSQVCAARVSAGPDKGRKGGRQAGRQIGRQAGGRTERVIRIQCEGGEWKGCKGGRGAAEQTITTISVPFKKGFLRSRLILK